MVYQRVVHYLWLKGDTYYFNRRVPKDMQEHYKSSRIIICLKTTRKDTALRSAKSMAQRRLNAVVAALQQGNASAGILCLKKHIKSKKRLMKPSKLPNQRNKNLRQSFASRNFAHMKGTNYLGARLSFTLLRI